MQIVTMFSVGVRLRALYIISVTVLLVSSEVALHAQPARLPMFEDYPVHEIFNRTPHEPLIATADQREFRTRIREGVEKGWGVLVNGSLGTEAAKPGSNFAGHYIVITWGCGAPCLRIAIADAKTGAIYSPPLATTAGGFAMPLLLFPNSVAGNPELEYRLNSALMIVKATPYWYRSGAVPYGFYFLWRRIRWTLLRRVPMADQ